MSSDFDFSQFEAFAANFDAHTQNDVAFIESVMNKLGNIMIREVKMRTPVGQYDNSVFFVSNGKLLVFESDSGSTRQGGELRRNWVLDGVQSTGDGYVVTISNNTEYASFVEHGHRTADHSGWVEGQFFLKITMEQIMNQLPKIVGPMWLEYLKGFGLS